MADELVRVAEAGGAEMDAAEAGIKAGASFHRAAPHSGSRGAIRSCEPARITKIRGNLRADAPG
jgi:hypothetical protein